MARWSGSGVPCAAVPPGETPTRGMVPAVRAGAVPPPSVLPVWSRLVLAKPVKVVGVKLSLDVLAEVAGDPKSSSSAMF